MLEFLKLIYDSPKSIKKRLIIVSLALLLLFISDYFTPFPSMIFTHEKYENIAIMTGLLKDTTLPNSTRRKIKSEIEDLTNRQSLRDHTQAFIKKNIRVANNISNIIVFKDNDTLTKSIAVFLSWVCFLLISNVMWGIVFILYGIQNLIENNPFINSKYRKDIPILIGSFAIYSMIVYLIIVIADSKSGVIQSTIVANLALYTLTILVVNVLSKTKSEYPKGLIFDYFKLLVFGAFFGTFLAGFVTFLEDIFALLKSFLK